MPPPESLSEPLTAPPIRSPSPPAPPLADAPEEYWTIKALINNPGSSITEETEQRSLLRAANRSPLSTELYTRLHQRARARLERAISRTILTSIIERKRLLTSRRRDADAKVALWRFLDEEMEQLMAWERTLGRLAVQGMDAEAVDRRDERPGCAGVGGRDGDGGVGRALRRRGESGACLCLRRGIVAPRVGTGLLE